VVKIILVKEIILNEKIIEQRMAIINQKNGVSNEKRCKIPYTNKYYF
jgi:hypothetical protein